MDNDACKNKQGLRVLASAPQAWVASWWIMATVASQAQTFMQTRAAELVCCRPQLRTRRYSYATMHRAACAIAHLA
jgi:hypothetical protein